MDSSVMAAAFLWRNTQPESPLSRVLPSPGDPPSILPDCTATINSVSSGFARSREQDSVSRSSFIISRTWLNIQGSLYTFWIRRDVSSRILTSLRLNSFMSSVGNICERSPCLKVFGLRASISIRMLPRDLLRDLWLWQPIM